MDTFLGYPRKDGAAGVRNHVLLIANCSCASGVIQRIAAEVPEAVPMLHTYGCSIPGEYDRWRKILIGVCTNPNVYAVVLVGVGCETDDAREIAKKIKQKRDMPVFVQIVQNDGGGEIVIEHCIRQAKAFIEKAKQEKRVEMPVSKLVLGTECGGSDALSGVTANPVIGYVADKIVDQGGTVLLSEVAEMIGADELLASRAKDKNTADAIKKLIAREEAEVRRYLGPDAARIIARGNMEGGLTTIQEKALGCIRKGGSRTIMDVIEYADPIEQRKGLIIMHGPGYDPVSLSGLFATGAQVTLFSTGRGNLLGYPAAPIVKVCSNSAVYERMGGVDGDMDINAGKILNGVSIEQVGEETYQFLLEVCSGKKSMPEKRGYGGTMCVFSASTPL